MSQHKYLSDNSGNRVAMHSGVVDPVAASGVKVIIIGTNTLTVEAGAKYAIYTDVLSTDGAFFSITGVTTVAANIEWVCAPTKTIVIKIPAGFTTLYLGTLIAAIVYIRKLN